MADNLSQKFVNGQLNRLDDMPPMDPKIGTAISSYSQSISNNKQSYKWIQAVQWVESILFGLGRQYIDDLLVTRISRDSEGNQSIGREFAKKIPKPTNDFIGRFVETNISLLTENRPQPRITAKSDARDDRQKAELSQLVIEYLWEELGLPEKHREIARIIMYCGVCFLETIWDETEQRHLAVQDTKLEQGTTVPGVNETPINLPVQRQVGVVDEEGRPVMKATVEYGDIRADVVSPFELHFPQVHWWEKIDWILKETYEPIQTIRDRYLDPGVKDICTKKNGWNLDALKDISSYNVQTLPLWWWERLANIVEGPGPSIYVGSPELWDDYCFDPETPVLKADLTWAAIKDIKIGDRLVGVDEHITEKYKHRKFKPCHVEKISTRTAQRYKITMSDGRELIATDNHPFLSQRKEEQFKWVKVKDLKIGDAIKDIGKPWDFDPTREAGYLSGIYDGEGWITKRHIGFGQNPGNTFDRVAKLLDYKGYNWVESNSKNSKVRKIQISGMKDYLRFIGSIRPHRLMDNSDKLWVGVGISNRVYDEITVKNIEKIDIGEVVNLQTTSRTFIANGFLTHNCVIKVWDRKPNPKWPAGRTVITVGDKVLYDSPKKIGARAYDARWPHRWHPYTRFRWEAQIGSIFGRSLVAKLVPKLKRINAIDTTLIMYGRTVPIATWIMPKGCAVPGTNILKYNGISQKIEDFCNTQEESKVQSLGSTHKVKTKMTYTNDETVIRMKAMGLLPISFTAGHHIPVVRKEVIRRQGKYGKMTQATLADIQDVPLQDIKVGDWVATSFVRERNTNDKINIATYVKDIPKNSKPVNMIVPLDDKFIRFLGLYLAEGCAKGNKKQREHIIQLTFNVNERDTLAQEAANLIQELFCITAKIVHDISESGERLQVQAYSTTIAQFLQAICGKGAKNKQIHDDIFFANTSLLPLLGGFIDGDGCVQSSGKTAIDRINQRTFKLVSARTISFNLANQLRGIALDEGIATNINEDRKRKNPIYTLSWDTTSLRQLRPFSTKLANQQDLAQKTSRQTRNIGNIFLHKVQKLTTVPYSGPVYDLEIEDKHYYQANGIIVHNTSPIEDQHTGRPGSYIEYDPRKTNGQAPTPVHPTAYPESLLIARDMCKQEMESMAGTEDVLRGQRPSGVNSAAMLDVLRKQALSSRSAILQAWDESLQHVGTSILQEVTKHVRGDSRYEERLKILSREKASRFTIKAFTGTDLSDNVVVRVDTASQAMVSKEAKQARAIEVMQYAPGLVALPVTLQKKLIDDLGWPDTMNPKSQDINRAQILLGFVKSNRFELCVPFPEDDAYVLHEFLVEDLKSEGFIDYPQAQQMKILELISIYQQEIERIEKAQIKMQMDMTTANNEAQGGQVPQ